MWCLMGDLIESLVLRQKGYGRKACILTVPVYGSNERVKNFSYLAVLVYHAWQCDIKFACSTYLKVDSVRVCTGIPQILCQNFAPIKGPQCTDVKYCSNKQVVILPVCNFFWHWFLHFERHIHSTQYTVLYIEYEWWWALSINTYSMYRTVRKGYSTTRKLPFVLSCNTYMYDAHLWSHPFIPCTVGKNKTLIMWSCLFINIFSSAQLMTICLGKACAKHDYHKRLI